jgi:tetratricopeptide (TPR) repeat protein
MSKTNKQSPSQQKKAIVQPAKPDALFNYMQQFENKVWWQLLLLILIPFFVYIKVANFEFINFDDVSIIVNNFDILSSFKNIGIAFKSDAFLGAHGDFYRPMQTVTFMVDTVIGKGNPLIYHLTNLLIHLGTVVSFYFLLRLFSLKNVTAFLFALLFAVHPVLTAAVSWVPARGDLLLGLFTLLLFNTFIQYITKRKTIYLILHVFLFALVMFSKEVAVVLPVVFLLYYFLILKESFDAKKIVPFIIVWAVIAAFFFYMRSKVVLGGTPDFILGWGPFLNDLPTIPIIIAKTILPINLSTMPLFESGFTALGFLLLIAIVIVLITQLKQKRWLPVLGFVWFLLFITPPLFFKIFYSKYLLEYYEHRAYVPVMGLLIMFAFLLQYLIQKTQKGTLILLPVILILAFAPMAIFHADNFKTSMNFFGNATERGNPGAAVKRGELYYGTRDFTNALSDFNLAIDLSNGEYPPAFYNRGKINSTVVKDHKLAEDDFSKTLFFDTSYIEAYMDRANERVLLQNYQGAYQDVLKAKQLDSNNAKVFFTSGHVYVYGNRFAEALHEFTKAIHIDTNYAEAYNDRAFVKYKLNDFYGGLNDCNKAIQLFPQFMNAYYNKGIIYLSLQKPDAAVKVFDTTLALTNNFYFGYFYRGMAKKDMKDMNGACADWNESVKLGFAMAQDTIRKYCK